MEVKDNKMIEFMKKPIVMLFKDCTFAAILIVVLYMNYLQMDKFMNIYQEQSKESAASQVELAKALQSLTDVVKDK